jgi:hypothetical protein
VAQNNLRRTIEAIIWRHRNGAKWRSIPSELGPWWMAAQTFIRCDVTPAFHPAATRDRPVEVHAYFGPAGAGICWQERHRRASRGSKPSPVSRQILQAARKLREPRGSCNYRQAKEARIARRLSFANSPATPGRCQRTLKLSRPARVPAWADLVATAERSTRPRSATRCWIVRQSSAGGGRRRIFRKRPVSERRGPARPASPE